MPIDFPNSPTIGQQYVYAGVTYVYTAQGVWSSINLSAAGGTAVNVQVFTTSANYVPSPIMVSCIIECIGGGGGGGGANSGGQAYFGGGGGGSGGYSRKRATQADIGASKPVTIGVAGSVGQGNPPGAGGVGGDTSVGVLCIAKGGGGGGFSFNNGTGIGNGGAGGSIVGAAGDVFFGGDPGGNGLFNQTDSQLVPCGGHGGSSAFGGGGVGGTTPSSLGGGNATNYGAGGGGGLASASNNPHDGGAGSAGVVIITEFGGLPGPKGDPGSLAISGPLGPPQGRLTLATATPVMTTTQSAKNRVYFTPYVGNLVPIYDGTNWAMMPTAEISVLTTDTTQNPAAVGVSQCHDWFVWNRSGTLSLSHGPAWTNDTTRSAGTALVRQNGILMNNVTIGNGTTTGPAASRGTYVGTTRSNASSLIDWTYGTSAVGGGAAWLGVWNAYNRVDVATEVIEGATSPWTPVPSAFRPVNGSVNNRVSAVFGLPEDTCTAVAHLAANQNDNWSVTAIGFDSTTAASGIRAGVHTNAAQWGNLSASYSTITQGFHFWQWLEASGTNNGAFAGTYGAVQSQSGMTFSARM